MYIESNVRYFEINHFEIMVKLYKRLGYSGIFVTFDFQQFFDIQKSTFKEEIVHNQNKEIIFNSNLSINKDNNFDSNLPINKEEEYKTKNNERIDLFGVSGLINKYKFLIDKRLEKFEIFRNIIEICKLNQIQVAFRVNIETDNQEDLKKKLSKIHDYDIIISVTTINKDCLIVASRDARVDIVSFINIPQIESVFKGAINQCYYNKKYIEIGFEPLISEKHTNRPKLMRYYSKFFKNLNFPRNKLIVGSNIKDPFNIRGPTELSAIIRTLFKVSEQISKHFFRETQEELLRTYLLRVSKQIGEMDVRIYEGEPNSEEYEKPIKIKEEDMFEKN